MPGLGTGCREAASIFLITAKSLDCVTAFDMNYREHLWTAKKAYAAWTEMLPYVDVIVTNRSVSEAVFEFEGTDEEIMRQYADEFGTRTVVLTSREVHGVLHGAWTSQALHDGELAQGRRFEFDVIDRFGSGDAFMAGLLYGYMERNADDPEYALDFGNALCALAHTIEGDIAEVSPDEVEAMLSDDYNLSPKR
jgi:2-dehydro-3-deoxygluconokinase